MEHDLSLPFDLSERKKCVHNTVKQDLQVLGSGWEGLQVILEVKGIIRGSRVNMCYGGWGLVSDRGPL